MKQSKKSLSLFDFQARFDTTDKCLQYLSDAKWANGYKCIKCNNEKYCNAARTYDRQCSKCNNISSPTSNTLFHKIKFDLVKAFHILYFVSTNKKGITSTELSRKLGLSQKVCWLFKRKAMKAMASRGNYPLNGVVEVDETVVGGQEEGVVGRKNDKKKLVVIAIEKSKKGVKRFYGRVIDKSSAKELGSFMKATIDKNAEITTDEWAGYKPLKTEFPNLKHKKSGRKGENFKEMHRVIMNFKSWLRGLHHSVEDLQEYINEYTYRFNRSIMTDNILDNLLIRMINTPPCGYKFIII